VRVLGFREDVDDLVAACDLVVHPSREDALPTALVSAIASGRAVVATDVGGIADIVGGGVGELVPSGDPGTLAARVTALVAQPRERAAMGDRGRARYEQEFSATVWAERLRAVYADAGRRPGGRDAGRTHRRLR
jgi:glycosyltransferase involved in cell wall biosynthesis